MGKIIDGKQVAEEIRQEIKEEVAELAGSRLPRWSGISSSRRMPGSSGSAVRERPEKRRIALTDQERAQQAWVRFGRLNEQYFDGKLHLDGLRFNRRFRSTLGRFSSNSNPRQRLIELSSFYLDTFGWEEMEKVLLHEMIHLKLNSGVHDRGFREVEADIAARYGPLAPKPIPVKHYRYVYACNRCGLRIGKWRRARGTYFHKNCGGRFRLKRRTSSMRSS